MLVRVKHDVTPLRHVIRIHGHALEVMRPIHKNAYLRIVSVSQVKVCNATTNFNDSVLVRAALIPIEHLDSA